MNYNVPFSPNNYSTVFNPIMDPFIKMQQLEQEVYQLKNGVNNLERRISTLENNKNNKSSISHLNSDVGTNNEGLYMI